MWQVAWLFLAPLGVLAARYFKHLEPAWFIAHQRLQWAALALAAPSLLLALCVLHPYLPLGRHGLIGLSAMLALFAQPLVAALRPAKTAATRSVRPIDVGRCH